MFRFRSKALKTNAWKGTDLRIHHQDYLALGQKVWDAVQEQFDEFDRNYYIKNELLSSWIERYGMGELLRAKDPAVKRAMTHIKDTLKNLVRSYDQGGQFRENELASFKKQYGSGITDWLYRLTEGVHKVARSTQEDPTEFDDVEVTIFDPSGTPIRTHALSGVVWVDDTGSVSVEILDESTEGISDAEWNASIIEQQIIDQVEV